MNQQHILETLKTQRLLPLYFHKDRDTSVNILRALYQAGVRVVEYTNRGPEALDNFRHMKAVRDAELKGLWLGAGTVKTEKDAANFIDAGTDFIIAPGLNEKVGIMATEKKLWWVPGCMTPSEIMRAEELGATLIKLFPGNLLGPGFLESIKELFPSLSFIPTGGVKLEKDNLQSWFKSGVIAVGAGSTLIDKGAVQRGDYASIEKSAASALALLRDIQA